MVARSAASSPSPGVAQDTTLDFEGRPVPVAPGDTVASALYRAGVRVFTRSFKYHRRRSLYCLTGDCPNCRVTVDDESGVRACVTEARPGLRVRREGGLPSVERDVLAVLDRLHWLLPVGFYYKTLLRPRWAWPLAEPWIRRLAGGGIGPSHRPAQDREARHVHPDVVVIGAGVAGLSAALAAAEAGRSVVICDEGRIGDKIAPGIDRERVDATGLASLGCRGDHPARADAGRGCVRGTARRSERAVASPSRPSQSLSSSPPAQWSGTACSPVTTYLVYGSAAGRRAWPAFMGSRPAGRSWSSVTREKLQIMQRR